ncbi:MAG: hypothetical protein ACO1TE_29225 [Prosthecobacter sp.]
MTVSISKRALAVVDETCRTKARGTSRAQLVRDALQYYLKEKYGIELTDDDLMPPPRGEVLLPPDLDTTLNEEAGARAPRISKPVVYERPRRPRKSTGMAEHLARREELKKSRP